MSDPSIPGPEGMLQHLTNAWDAQRAAQNAIIAEETRKALLAGTRKFLERVDVKALDEMRKSLELPPEALGALIELHAKRVAESDQPREAIAHREVLPLSIDKLVRPGQCAEITARPQRSAFRPERLYISDAAVEDKGPWWKRLWPWFKPAPSRGAADWVIHDIRIGNRSQFSQAGSIPGDMFSRGARDSFVSFEVAQTAMDVKLVVEYIGPRRKGQRFYGAMIGTTI